MHQLPEDVIKALNLKENNLIHYVNNDLDTKHKGYHNEELGIVCVQLGDGNIKVYHQPMVKVYTKEELIRKFSDSVS